MRVVGEIIPLLSLWENSTNLRQSSQRKIKVLPQFDKRGVYFTEESVLEIDHIIPKSKGGKNDYKNLQLLHRHCHDEKTTNDGSSGDKSGCNSAKPKPSKTGNRGTHDKSLIAEEPCEVKVSSTVLKTSGSREGIA